MLIGGALLACLGTQRSLAVEWPGFGTAGPGAAGPGVARSAAVPAWKVWLCEPDLAVDFCHANLTSTVVHAGGSATVVPVAIPANLPVDCFYVYPTVSIEKRGNSDLRIQIDEKATAVAEAAEFEQVCRMYAPMYRQVTVYGSEYHPNYGLEYEDVLAAWRDYLASRARSCADRSLGGVIRPQGVDPEADREVAYGTKAPHFGDLG